jgi:hypothetical protein
MFVVFVAAFGEEVLYRGIMWRALMPKGLLQTVITTSLLYSIPRQVRVGASLVGSGLLSDAGDLQRFRVRSPAMAHRFDLARSTVFILRST